MRKILLTAILAAGVIAVFASPPAGASVSVTVSITSFHQTLTPYGRWVVTRGYGEVWIPAGIVVSWEPYSDGEWIWTDYGWTWVSYDPWGDIPCHYGTWAWVDPYGWVWVPGTVWAPAWVTWAWTDDYIGWAPVPPTFVLASSGYSGPAVVAAPTRYVFVPANQFVGVNVRTARVAVSQNPVILSRARRATRFAVSGGIVRATANPPLAFVQRVSGKRIERASIEKLKARPSPISAAHVSGKSIRVVAPSNERAAAGLTKKKEIKTASGAQARGDPSAVKKKTHQRIASEPVKPKSEKTMARQSHDRTTSLSGSEHRATHEAPPGQGLPPFASGPETRKHEKPQDSHEQKHGRTHVESGAPPGEPSGETLHGSGPPPQVRENPQPPPPPPPQAAKPPPPAKGKEKEKGRD